MSPVSPSFKHLQQRLRRSLCYGNRRMKSLPFPLSELAMNYFDKHCPYDYMSMDLATSLARNGCVDACTFLVAMVYLDRLRTSDKTCFEASDPSELYLAALVIAGKYLHDVGQREFIYNDEWAASASTSLRRVNEMELTLLDALRWNISVSNVEFMHILEEAEIWVAKNNFCRRGFLTYNEVAILNSRINLLSDYVKPLIISLAAFTIIYSAAFVSVVAFTHVTISASLQRDLVDNDKYMLSTISTAGSTTQMLKAFSLLHENSYKCKENQDNCIGFFWLCSWSVCAMRVCVIGAGASGLPAIKECRAVGLDVIGYERTSDIGGLWNYRPELTVS
uniref:Flavin-containing monooxygenase n=1 Tax=Setaria digitata TaxID=48799 RepID=A0A915PBR5_9BILA